MGKPKNAFSRVKSRGELKKDFEMLMVWVNSKSAIY